MKQGVALPKGGPKPVKMADDDHSGHGHGHDHGHDHDPLRLSRDYGTTPQP